MSSNNNNNKNTNAILSNLIEEAKNLKLEGNTYFTTQNYEAAQITYARGLKVIQSLESFLQNNQQNQQQHQEHGIFFIEIMTIKIALVSNQAFVLNKLNNSHEADILCTRSLLEIENIIRGVENDNDNNGNNSKLWKHVEEDVVLTGQIKCKFVPFIFLSI